MLRLFSKMPANEEPILYPNSLIVGEAKTSTKQMDSQLKKYLNTGLFDWGFEIHPFKTKASDVDRGMFCLDEQLMIHYTPASRKYIIPDGKKILPKEKYIKWLENYMKFYLIANLSNDEFTAFYENETGEKISTQDALANFIINLSPSTIINHINNIL